MNLKKINNLYIVSAIAGRAHNTSSRSTPSERCLVTIQGIPAYHIRESYCALCRSEVLVVLWHESGQDEARN